MILLHILFDYISMVLFFFALPLFVLLPVKWIGDQYEKEKEKRCKCPSQSSF